tara:strand:+ start:9 stop:2123 length:2115 start_codon:yes stop_codon:yes gene_type:complete
MKEQHKKESPILSILGMGGGGTGNAFGGVAAGPNKVTASGGVIADYSDGGTKYRAHIFTNSGALTISAAEPDATIEYLVVGGGGGGGFTLAAYTNGGGGGAGGLRTNVAGVQNAGGTSLTAAAYPVSAGTYTVNVGNGGVQGCVPGTKGQPGSSSSFYPTSHSSYPAVQYIRGAGGGGGGNAEGQSPNANGGAGNDGGGSGGGTTYYTTPFANQPGGSVGAADPNHPKPAGNVGGSGPPGGSNGCISGGGGGAGAAGGNGRAPASGNVPVSDIALGRGGIGVQVAIAGPSTASPVGTPGPSGNGWFAGGGGGGLYSNPPSTEGNGSAPLAGGGSSGAQGPGSDNAPTSFSPAQKSYGQQMTGGGGGGGKTSNPGVLRNGTPGQPGVVIVRYELPQQNASSQAKATGGAVSKVGSKIVHVFHHPGSLVVPATIPSINYFIVGGGGAGSGADGGGGGGAGGIKTNIASILPAPHTGGARALPAATHTITVGRGGSISGATPTSGEYQISTDGESTVYDGITAGGGGAGGFGGPSGITPTAYGTGNDGLADNGSGGGGGSYGSSGRGGGTGNGAGNDGKTATGIGVWAGGGGGGAGASSTGINGGAGLQLPTTYHDPSVMTVGAPGPSSSWGWFAGGGGGGGGDPNTNPAGGVGGGGRGEDGDSPFNKEAIFGMRGTGGGGGGGDQGSAVLTSGMGGPGIVIVAYDA